MTIVRGEPFSIRAQGAPEALDALVIQVRGDTLHVGRTGIADGQDGQAGVGASAVVHITMPTVRSVSLVGSGDLNIDAVEAPSFDAFMTGSGEVEVGNLRSTDVHLELTGSGDFIGIGKVTNLDIDLAGSGDVDAQVADEAVATLTGSGDVGVTGGARCEADERGAGTMRCD